MAACFSPSFTRIDEAFAREKQVQGWSRAKKIALIEGDIAQLKHLSRNRSSIYKVTPPPAPPESSSESIASPVPEPAKSPVPEPAEGYFGEYPPDFFDFIIIDECHRGGANDEGNWRGIMEHFSPAVQLGLTATPRRRENADTYAYFGEPVYTYSLKDGINDGFLTPFRVKQIQTTVDYYTFTPDDTVVEGEIEVGRLYDEPDFNRNIEIVERERKRVEIFMGMIDQREKTLVFCATQDHALLVHDLINQTKTSTDPNYCQRVTANDGKRGEEFLRDFQDNEKTIPTILTTSQISHSASAWHTATRTPPARQSEAGRRQRACHPTHDRHLVLAPGRHADVGIAVHGSAFRQAARVFPG